MRKWVGGFALCVVFSVLPRPAGAEAPTTTLAFSPVADTFVNAESSAKSYASYAYLSVDGSPVKNAYLRFYVAGLEGKTVTGVRLRLYQDDVTKMGGRVHAMADTGWSEAMTFNTQPAVSGPQLAAFGAVSQGAWYEVSLGAGAVTGDGAVAFALTSDNTNGAKWSSRESANPPQLLVNAEGAPPPPTEEGLSTVAGPTAGSSDPTFFASQHRVVRTKAGRTLAVYGTHASGVSVAWRDGAGPWSAAPLLSGTGTGDWPASIALATTPDGVEHAWAVWGGTTGFGEKPRPVEMRRLSKLDDPAGPAIGPVVTVAAPGAAGNGRVDIGFERLANGAPRGWLFYVHRLTTADSSSEQHMASFDGVGSDAPTLNAPAVLSSTRSPLVGTFVAGPNGGLKLVARHTSGALTLYRHDAAAAVGGWTTPKAGIALASASRPAAAALPTGEVLAVVESDTANHVVTVQRFGADAAPKAPELTLTGYREPTVVADPGGGALLVAVRHSDGALVSRALAGGAWSAADRVEIGPEGGGNYQWPNAIRQSDGRLRLIVRGPSGGSNQTSVLSLVRPL